MNTVILQIGKLRLRWVEPLPEGTRPAVGAGPEPLADSAQALTFL